MLGGPFPNMLARIWWSGATESQRSLVVHTSIVIIFCKSVYYFTDYLLLSIASCLSRSAQRTSTCLIFQISYFKFSSFLFYQLLLYSLLGYLLTRIESRRLLQYSYHITKICWSKANRTIYQVCLFQGTNAWKTALKSQLLTPRTNSAYYQNSLNKLRTLRLVILINSPFYTKFK
jgi:hypothetical protein